MEVEQEIWSSNSTTNYFLSSWCSFFFLDQTRDASFTRYSLSKESRRKGRAFADHATGNNMAVARLDRIGARGAVWCFAVCSTGWEEDTEPHPALPVWLSLLEMGLSRRAVTHRGPAFLEYSQWSRWAVVWEEPWRWRGTMSAANKVLSTARIKCICVRANKVGWQERHPSIHRRTEACSYTHHYQSKQAHMCTNTNVLYHHLWHCSQSWAVPTVQSSPEQLYECCKVQRVSVWAAGWLADSLPLGNLSGGEIWSSSIESWQVI